MSKRKKNALDFKAKVALEALKGDETAAALARRFSVGGRQSPRSPEFEDA